MSDEYLNPEDLLQIGCTCVKVEPKVGKENNTILFSFSAPFSIKLLGELGEIFDQTVKVYIDKNGLQPGLFNNNDTTMGGT